MFSSRGNLSICSTLLLSCLMLFSSVKVNLSYEGVEVISSTSGGSGNGQTSIGVYIESLCPDSRRFILQQLVPTNRELAQLFQVKIIPFGKARVLGNNKMVCQHGQRECDGNRKMACILARASNQSAAIETIACLFKSLDQLQECLKEHLPMLNPSEIETCSKGDESYKLMVEAEKETGRLDYVPHLTLNGKHDEELEYNLKKVVCQQYKSEPKPDACKSMVAN